MNLIEEIKPKSNLKNPTIIIGSPGCGKTTELMRRIEELFSEGVKPHEIGFLTFSVAAIDEATARTLERFQLKKDDIPYFRTLHSMAYHLLGLTKDQVFDYKHHREFAKLNDYNLSYNKDFNIEGFQSKDDKLLQYINIARLKNKTLHQYYTEEVAMNDINVSYNLLNEMSEKYQAYKIGNCLFDYTDMIMEAVNEPQLYIPKFKHLFIDEAQDLSRIQWKLIEKIASRSDDIVIAGDDKQSINMFAGADVEYFVKLEGTIQVLKQSYRIPRAVHALAKRIMDLISFKRDVEWIPRDVEGSVTKINLFDYSKIAKSKEDWLILCRTKAQLVPIQEELMKHGVLFTICKRAPIDTDVFQAIKLFMSEHKDTFLDSQEYKGMFTKFISSRYFDSLRKNKCWKTAFTRLSKTERDYAELLYNKKEAGENVYFNTAKVRLNTIHGAKGTEATNVILLNKASKIIMEDMLDNPENEYKVVFVGVTRAKQNLYILEDIESSNSYSFL